MAQVSEPTPAATNLGPGKVLRVLNIKLTSFLLVITVLGSFFMDQYQDFFESDPDFRPIRIRTQE